MLTPLERELVAALRAMLRTCYDIERDDKTHKAVKMARAAVRNACTPQKEKST